MSDDGRLSNLCWDRAAGMPQAHDKSEAAPQGMLVPDSSTDHDKVAVVYDKGAPPPEITIRTIAGNVHSVLADGVAVAVVARAAGPGLSVEDILLVERAV
ncbi:hypothetical protein Z946_3659 [Sulfitobacter noctilucicola]|uniref:Uncharacterized protein n=1 Tax=Sulfitobacter noctilucicola TaxID=1342301 RepID=A0A7W6M8H1_9RHOB|nr:hypothetical protein [Sulfitobacter noctilucicola]KIN64767.1 hypothetical protein Z946_3659 [Sulfitobacter noctilucicola]MBB4174087.1 hypothetical protein [Sulfitobacter noctilucicola]